MTARDMVMRKEMAMEDEVEMGDEVVMGEEMVSSGIEKGSIHAILQTTRKGKGNHTVTQRLFEYLGICGW